MEAQLLREELTGVEAELASMEQELECLLAHQQELAERRELLRAQLDSIASCEEDQEECSHTTGPGTSLFVEEGDRSRDWEHGSYAWTERVHLALTSQFKLESFRPLQLSCVNAAMAGKDVILIMPTGGGKSLCYQLPATVKEGMTLVISPLVSLMEDQLLAVRKFGIEATALNASSSKEEVSRVHTLMITKKTSLKLLYVTPEKIAKSKRFLSKLEKAYDMGNLSAIVIDEIHCASQWGHDFRPDYKFLGILKRQFPNAPIMGLTATASAKVLSDCQEILSLKRCLVFRASYNRPNLFYEVRSKPAAYKSQVEQLVSLIVTDFPNKSGIIYCLSRKNTKDICVDLTRSGIKAGCYHADLPPKERTRVHTLWLKNSIQVIVATVAFGMGIDKPDVRFVVHHTISKSMENYYQESGRAGRDGGPASCILLFRPADAFRQSTMTVAEQTGLANLYEMLRYCLNEDKCRRSTIARSFGDRWQKGDCPGACDVCCRGGSAGESSSLQTPEDIAPHCRRFLQVLDGAKERNQRMTALMLVEAAIATSSTSPSSSSCTGSELETSVYSLWRILMLALLEGVLKEDFHFTPYSTISYIVPGRKAGVVRSGSLKLLLPTRNVRGSCKSSVMRGITISTNVKSAANDIRVKEKTQQSVCDGTGAVEGTSESTTCAGYSSGNLKESSRKKRMCLSGQGQSFKKCDSSTLSMNSAANMEGSEPSPSSSSSSSTKQKKKLVKRTSQASCHHSDDDFSEQISLTKKKKKCRPSSPIREVAGWPAFSATTASGSVTTASNSASRRVRLPLDTAGIPRDNTQAPTEDSTAVEVIELD